MKKILCFLLCAALIVAQVVPVSADELVDGWIELLQFTSVQANNENWFIVSGGSGSFTLPLHTEKRLSRVDMLIWHQTADYPVSAKVGNMSLQVIRIENNLSRISGLIPNAFYEKLTVNFGVSSGSSAVWELLSCRVTPIAQTDYAADAEFYQRADLTHYKAPAIAEFYGNGSGSTVPDQFCVQVNDWRKYDSITIVGSIQGFGLNSIRASIGNVGLPYTLTYTSTNSNGSDSSYYLWSDVKEYVTNDTRYQGSVTGSVFESTLYDGKVLFNLTIDLTGIDRSLSYLFTVWFTGIFPDSAYIVQIVGVTGSVQTADTSDVTWWNRFTSFMTDLFGGDTSKADEFAQEMEQTSDQIHDANEQLNSVTKPSVEEVPMDPSQYLDSSGTAQAGQIVQTLLGNQLVLPMASITLIVGLAAFIIF